MTIKRKTKEELLSQGEGFLEYAKLSGDIRNRISKKILKNLSENGGDLVNSDEIKDSLRGILSDDRFDELYFQYEEFFKAIGGQKNIEKFFEILDSRVEDDKSGKHNIEILINYGLTGERLLELWKYILYFNDKVVKNIMEKLEGFGINVMKLDNDEFKTLKKIFSHWKSAEKNLSTLKDFGINIIDDFANLGNVLSSNNDVLVLILKKFPKISLKELNDINRDQSKMRYNSLYLILQNGSDSRLKLILLKYPEISINQLIGLDIIISWISSRKDKMIDLIFKKYPDISPEQLAGLGNIICEGSVKRLNMIFERYPGISPKQLAGLDDIMDDIDDRNYSKDLKIIFKRYPNISLSELNQLKNNSGCLCKNLKIIFKRYPNISLNDFIGLSNLLSISEDTNLKRLFDVFDGITIEELKNNQKIGTIELPKKLNFKENNHNGYLPLLNAVASTEFEDEKKIEMVEKIVGLTFKEAEKYLKHLEDLCINKKIPYDDFLKCFDGKTINPKAIEFLLRGFDISGPKDTDAKLLSDSINKLYPGLNIEFNDEDVGEILGFVDGIGGINKGYSILILTIEKMLRDGVKGMNFNRLLIEKLRNYKKVLDMYPEDKIPDGLKISVGLEFEMTKYFVNWYEQTTGKKYHEVVDHIVKNAKVGIEREGVYEFATKPSTNPMAALLEIHLLNELNLLDINNMQKLLELEDLEDKKKKKKKKDDIYLNIGNTEYNGRNGTGYHLNIGSDADIGVDENIQFIQNLCTILPRSGMNNGGNVSTINRYSNIYFKSSSFSVFPNSESKKYIELRTYSVDDVELFEKNILFNSYAIMGSQAQKKVSTVTPEIVIGLRENDKINNSKDLMRYLEDNNLFKDNQDLKSKRVATEFIFMQICVLRAISDYNHNFIDNELFGIDEVSNNLNESWRNYFIDLLCLDNRELVGYTENGHSSGFVKIKCKKLYSAFVDGSFSFNEYLEKNEPFSDAESKKILNKYGEVVDENKISLVTIRLNKRLLWEKLIIGCDDTQKLEGLISNKWENINRIKSSIKGMNQTLKVDKQYLKNYFKTNMSLIQYNPYHSIDTDFMNKIINLNNFFLKKDDTNANGVLETTVLDGDKNKEEDISKFSIFERGKMRKGYNYYQGGSENMLLHKTQTIAINYMENVKNILNTDYDENIDNKTNYSMAA